MNNGQRELWQEVLPKDHTGLTPMTAPISVTPDGKYVAYHYGTILSQLYTTDSLR